MALMVDSQLVWPCRLQDTCPCPTTEQRGGIALGSGAGDSERHPPLILVQSAIAPLDCGFIQTRHSYRPASALRRRSSCWVNCWCLTQLR